MGNCFGHSADSNISSSRASNTQIYNKVVTKGQQLKKIQLKWKSDIQLTKYHIDNKRAEFWDTAPAFEGRQEIWDALKAAVEAIEKNDFELAQAIIYGASIILPAGSLRDCYDELGNRYQLPLYVLSYPYNMIVDSIQHLPNVSSEKRKTGHTKVKDAKQIVSSEQTTGSHHLPRSRPTSQGSMVTLNLRLSTGKDIKLSANYNQTITAIKDHFSTICGVPTCDQRWYCYGKLIDNANLLSDCIIPDNAIIQVIVRNPGENNIDQVQG